MKGLLILLGGLLFSFPGWAQKGSIRGTVKTADGLAAEFVTVGLKEASLGATTDAKGEFLFLNIAPGTYTLEARFIGFTTSNQTVRVEAGKATTVALILTANANQLSEVKIQGYIAYSHDQTNLATRTATPLKKIPQSIQVIPQQILQDQQAFNINEVVRNVAGIAQFSTYQDYTMRGFRSNDGNFAYNGVRGALYQFDLPGQLYNVERIEAIKGPASSLFSNASPGGIINIVTKQPQATPKYQVQTSYGTYNQFRFVGDATGPLSPKLRYRLIAGYENAGAINAVQDIRHLFLAPSLAYQFSDRTNATLELNMYNDRRTVGFERGIFAAQRPDGSYNLEAVPIRWSRHNPDDFSKTRGLSGQLRLSHQFTKSVALHALVRTVQSYQEQQEFTSSFGGLVTTNENILKNRYLQYFRQKPLFAFQSNLYTEAKLQTGTLHHTFIAGLDAGNFGRTYYYASWKAPDLNVLDPNYAEDYPVDRSQNNQNFGGETQEDTRLMGGYVQDQIALSSKLNLLLGLRYDTYNYKSESTDDFTPDARTSDNSTASVWLPRLGLVYSPLPQLSLYGSYSQGFQPQYSNLKAAGGPFDPEKGEQYEVGAKAELLAGKLIPTLAFYRLRKENILIPDPTDIEGIRQLSDGNALSKGVELTVQGNLNQNISLITSYAYNETKNLKGGEFGAPEGSWYPMAPNNSANAWLKYSFREGALHGLNLNGGFQHVGKRNTFTPGFSLPAFTTLDAGISYRFKGATLAGNLYNLTNLRHYTGGYGRGIFWAGMPRSFRVSLGYQF